MSFPSNKRAHFDFEILETLSAGVELFGTEVKSLKAGQGKLDGSYVVVRGGEAFLGGASIPAFQPKNTKPDYDSERPRRLLLTKKEIDAAFRKSEREGLTIVPIKWYNIKQHIKLEIGIARGKKKQDKREAIKKRDVDRELRRTLKFQ